MRLSLRLKLGLISLLLLAIPYSGYRLSGIIKKSLVNSRKETLMFSARAVASALSGRKGLFNKEGFHELNRKNDLYLYHLTNPMRLNGETDDWQSHLKYAVSYGLEHALSGAENYSEKGSGFRHLLGQRANYLYALFIVRDDSIVYRQKNSLALDRSDHLLITIERQGNARETYIVTPTEPGWINGIQVIPQGKRLLPKRNEFRIQGVWQPNKTGYVIELRMPLVMLGKKIAFAIADVDDPAGREIACVIGTADTQKPESMGWLLSQSSDINKILTSLSRPQSRIQVVDTNKHIRANYGSLNEEENDEEQQTHRKFSLYHLLQPLFKFFIEPLSTDIPEAPSQPTILDLKGVDEALAGESSITSYRIAGSSGEIMTAITPLMEEGKIIGAVVVEQTTNSILALQNRLIEESFAFTFTVLIFGGVGLFLFAFRTSSRIRSLRDSTAQSVASNGQILSIPQASSTKDEIGDLSRALHSILTRLKAQEQYHEKMADNLEHEMRTPLAGASASLKNLTNELENVPADIRNYVTWALRDIKRMEDLLTAIRDATSLTNALNRGFREDFNITAALRMWLEHGWRQTFVDVLFEADLPEEEIILHGDPDRILQMLDKLIENGVAFRAKETPMVITMNEERNGILLTVFNQGPHIPEEMLEEIFNSMISARTTQDQKPHLGLGLFIVRTIVQHHGGTVHAENIKGRSPGVRFSVFLPLGEE